MEGSFILWTVDKKLKKVAENFDVSVEP